MSALWSSHSIQCHFYSNSSKIYMLTLRRLSSDNKSKYLSSNSLKMLTYSLNYCCWFSGLDHLRSSRAWQEKLCWYIREIKTHKSCSSYLSKWCDLVNSVLCLLTLCNFILKFITKKNIENNYITNDIQVVWDKNWRRLITHMEGADEIAVHTEDSSQLGNWMQSKNDSFFWKGYVKFYACIGRIKEIFS